MTESELNKLELQIDSFVKSFQQLTIENNSLRNKMSRLKQEHVTLTDKKKKIAETLRKIISQLQDEMRLY